MKNKRMQYFFVLLIFLFPIADYAMEDDRNLNNQLNNLGEEASGRYNTLKLEPEYNLPMNPVTDNRQSDNHCVCSFSYGKKNSMPIALPLQSILLKNLSYAPHSTLHIRKHNNVKLRTIEMDETIVEDLELATKTIQSSLHNPHLKDSVIINTALDWVVSDYIQNFESSILYRALCNHKEPYKNVRVPSVWLNVDTLKRLDFTMQHLQKVCKQSQIDMRTTENEDLVQPSLKGLCIDEALVINSAMDHIITDFAQANTNREPEKSILYQSLVAQFPN